MYAFVLCLNGFDKELVYSIPPELHAAVLPGTVVKVPLQRMYQSALVIRISHELDPSFTFKIRAIHKLEPFPADPTYATFLAKLAAYNFSEPLHFYARLKAFLKEKTTKTVAPEWMPDKADAATAYTLSAEQQAVVDYVTPHIITPAYTPVLIHGVTGSGKTEVYKHLITAAHAQGKTVLFLSPEVTLCLQFERLFKAQLANIHVMGFHSATGITHKRALWQALCNKEPILICGVHLPVLLPIANLGLVIVDEEHEQGFTEKKHPKVNSKHAAILKAFYANVPVVLGSATPSLSSLHNVQSKGWKQFNITKRFAGNFPAITKVILSEKKQPRSSFWVSRELYNALTQCLAAKEQAIIYLNRRGFSFFVQCKNCGFIFQCPDCSVSLTLHSSSKGEQLCCHYCDYHTTISPACPTCKSSADQFLKKGIGTQQAVQVFQELFPTARIARADLDTTRKKNEWHSIVQEFTKGNLDILIGTQTVTKGYDFPGVTLVGIIWADLNLHFPVYHAAESTIQQLIQVAGRAGRHTAQSRVIVQALHDHPIFDYLDEQKYIDFCSWEAQARKEAGYPPFAKLITLELRHTDVATIHKDADMIANTLREYITLYQPAVTLLGPSLPLVHKIATYNFRHIVLKSTSINALHAVVNKAFEQYTHSQINVSIQ